MVTNIKVNLKMEIRMEKVYIITKMEINTKDNLKMIKYMEEVYIILRVGISM